MYAVLITTYILLYVNIVILPGTVKWVGVLDEDTIAPELYVGVRLDDNSKYPQLYF